MCERSMPLKTKIQRQLKEILEKARELKRSRVTDEGSSASAESGRHDADSGDVDLVQLVTMAEDAPDTDDEAVDPSFDLDSSLKSDLDHLQERF